MKASKLLIVVLFVSGVIAIGVGAGILFFPVAFYATNDVALGGQTSLLNEVRAAGGAILGAGLLVFAGAFVERFRFSAGLISAVLYLSYGASRILSVFLDGIPAGGLLLVTALELAIGGFCLFAWLKYQQSGAGESSRAGAALRN